MSFCEGTGSLEQDASAAIVAMPYTAFTIHESGAIGAGMSPNGEYFVVGFKDRATIYKTENGGVYRQIHLLGCNVIGVSFASNDSVAISCTNGQSGLYGLNGGKIRSL